MSTPVQSAIKTVMNRYFRNAELDEFLEEQLGDAGYGGVDIQRTPLGTRMTLFVSRPGLVIGRRGVGIRDLTEKIGQKFGLTNPQISVAEIEVPELDPRIMCSRIAHTVSRGTRFRRAAQWTLNSIMEAGALGAEIVVSGKLRSERSRFEKFKAGIVPKSGETAKAVVVEATKHLRLKMGLNGIKIKIAIKEAIPNEVLIIEPKSPRPQDEDKEEEEKVAKAEVS